MSHFALIRLTPLLAAALLLAMPVAGCAPQPTAVSPIAELSSSDVSRVSTAIRLLKANGAEVWPDWIETTPILLRHGENDFLIGHNAPPAGFDLIEQTSLDDLTVHRADQHLVPVPAATTWLVAGQWCVAVPTLDEFQEAIDAAVGPGVVQLDDTVYVRVVLHEAFHAHQMTLMQGALPDFGAQLEEPEALRQLAQADSLDRLHAAEGQALRAGIEASSAAEARQAAARFLQLREQRRAGQPGISAYEQSLEWAEGLARYADIRLMLLAALRDEQPGDVWAEHLGQLTDPASIATGLRDRYAAFGAAQAFLLDRLQPDWKSRALPGGTSLEALLREAVY